MQLCFLPWSCWSWLFKPTRRLSPTFVQSNRKWAPWSDDNCLSIGGAATHLNRLINQPSAWRSSTLSPWKSFVQQSPPFYWTDLFYAILFSKKEKHINKLAKNMPKDVGFCSETFQECMWSVGQSATLVQTEISHTFCMNCKIVHTILILGRVNLPNWHDDLCAVQNRKLCKDNTHSQPRLNNTGVSFADCF